jgi:hypothetical protein
VKGHRPAVCRKRHVGACRLHYPNVLAGNDIAKRLAALQPPHVGGDVVDATGESAARVDSKQLYRFPFAVVRPLASRSKSWLR